MLSHSSAISDYLTITHKVVITFCHLWNKNDYNCLFLPELIYHWLSFTQYLLHQVICNKELFNSGHPHTVVVASGHSLGICDYIL